MRIKDKTARVLIDLPLVQAARLKEPHYQKALREGAFDPFPDGTQANGVLARRGVLATNSGIATTQLSGAPLTGFDSALPDHIQAALQAGLHDDDTGLRDFLAIFDRRLLTLDVAARKAAVLVATQDAAGRHTVNVLTRLLALVRREPDDMRPLKLLLPLLSRARSLEGVRDMLRWWTGHNIEISARFDRMRPIDRDSLGYVTARRGAGVALGRGALLGRFGRTPLGHIAVRIACMDRADLDRLVADTQALAELRSVTRQYLRDPVPVTFYAAIERRSLSAPRLSATRARADRLGRYNLLHPERRPDARADIKLTEIKA